MSEFRFKGEIESSKSLFNRALIAKSFDSRLQLLGQSACDDVRVMQTALENLALRKPLHCGDAGTVIRFLGPRVAREPGSFFLEGSPRLLSRPMNDLKIMLAPFGVQCEVASHGLRIEGEGWKKPTGPVLLRRDKSSQFASGLLLSAWSLDFDLELEFDTEAVSEAYWSMTLSFLEQMGMEIERRPNGLRIPSGQSLTARRYEIEPDYSSMFAVACAGVLFGGSQITNAGHHSLQPDFAFIQILREMQAHVGPVTSAAETKDLGLLFGKSGKLKALAVDLRNSPDLFPVMAVLCSFAEGVSELGGAPHLIFKESDRLSRTEELLQRAGIQTERLAYGLRIQGRGLEWMPVDFQFDPDQDHRMAMAAGLLQIRNPKIQIANPHVVDKSFPEFWSILESGLNGGPR